MMIKRLFALSALTLGSAVAAHSTPVPVNGVINIVGSATFGATSAVPGYSYEVKFSNVVDYYGQTGSFVPLNPTFPVPPDFYPVSMFPAFGAGTELPFNLGTNAVPAAISPVEVLTTTGGGETVDFFMTQYDASIVTNVVGCGHETCLDVTGMGFFTETGVINYTSSPGVFTFTAQQPSLDYKGLGSFSATGIADAPEPSSLVLLGSGLLGVAGLARRRYSRK